MQTMYDGVKVLLSACETNGDLTYFNGELLDGVGIEADPSRGRYAEQLWLWRYRQGRRISEHVEPLFGDEPPVIVHSRGTSYSEIDSYTVEGERFSGLVATFEQGYSTSQAHLITLREVIDSLPTGSSMSWHKDGSVNEIAKAELQKTDAGLLSIMRYERRRDTSMGNSTDRSRVSLSVGHDIPATRSTLLPTVDDNALYPPFRALDHDDPGFFVATCAIGFDENQKIESIELSNPDYFPFLEQHPVSPEPCRWLPTSLLELTEIGVGTRLEIRLNSDSLQVMLTAFGPDGLHPVADLQVATYLLEVGDIAILFGLPNLKHLSVRDHTDPDDHRDTREMLTDLKTRRPNIQITLNKRPFLPNGVTLTD